MSTNPFAQLDAALCAVFDTPQGRALAQAITAAQASGHTSSVLWLTVYWAAFMHQFTKRLSHLA